jgi:hypothetical protein
MKPYSTTDRAEAQAIAKALDSRTYHLAHGEHSRPDYTVRKKRGRNEFEIYAKYYYFAGTYYRRPNGAISEETANITPA